MLREHDVVAMVQDVSAAGLRRGDVGAVVHVYADEDTCEVEFIDKHGKPRGVATVPETHVMKLNLSSLSA